MKYEQAKKEADGPVVLLVDRVSAHGKLCREGMQISPNVEGWPVHRVIAAVQHGHAVRVNQAAKK